MSPKLKKAIKKSKRKIGPLAITAILMLGVLSSMLIFLPTTARAEWWDNDYEHCKVLTIANGVNSYKGMWINVTYSTGGDVNCESNCQADFDDIRFTNIDNSTLLNYWRESYVSSDWARFWVELPSNLTTTNQIVMYYDNPTGSDGSNGSATFYFFDDFTTNTTSEWAESTGVSAAIPVIRHYEQVVAGVGYDTRFRYRANKTTWTTAAGGVSNRIGYINNTKDANNYNPDDAVFILDTPDTGEGADASTMPWKCWARDDAAWATLPDYEPTTFTSTDYLIWDQTLISTNYSCELYDDDGTWLNRSLIDDVTPPGIPPEAELSRIWIGIYFGSGGWSLFEWDSGGYLHFGGYRTSGSYNLVNMDWIFLGDYASTEPSVSAAGSQDTRTSASSYTLTGLTGTKFTWSGQASETVWNNGSGTYQEDIELQLNITDSDNVTDVLARIGNLNDTTAYVNASNFTLYVSSDGTNFAVLEHDLGNGNGIFLDSPTGVNISTNSSTWPSSGAGADPFPVNGGGAGVWDNASIYYRVVITIPAGTPDDFFYEGATWYLYPGYYS